MYMNTELQKRTAVNLCHYKAPLNSILRDPGAANWDRIFRSLTATDKVYDKNRRAS